MRSKCQSGNIKNVSHSSPLRCLHLLRFRVPLMDQHCRATGSSRRPRTTRSSRTPGATRGLCHCVRVRRSRLQLGGHPALLARWDFQENSNCLFPFPSFLFTNTGLNCAQALGLEAFRVPLVLKAHRAHRVHQAAATPAQWPTVGTSLGRASALRSRNIWPVSDWRQTDTIIRFTAAVINMIYFFFFPLRWQCSPYHRRTTWASRTQGPQRRAWRAGLQPELHAAQPELHPGQLEPRPGGGRQQGGRGHGLLQRRQEGHRLHQEWVDVLDLTWSVSLLIL